MNDSNDTMDGKEELGYFVIIRYLTLPMKEYSVTWKWISIGYMYIANYRATTKRQERNITGMLKKERKKMDLHQLLKRQKKTGWQK